MEIDLDKFQIGKWYKYAGWYLKLGSIRNNIFIAEETINKKDRFENQKYNNFTCGTADYEKILLEDLSEIQQYLPKGHPDLLPSEPNYEIY